MYGNAAMFSVFDYFQKYRRNTKIIWLSKTFINMWRKSLNNNNNINVFMYSQLNDINKYDTYYFGK